MEEGRRDSECAVANSLAAVQNGAVHIQGTINGIGERCGNANLCSIIPNLELKMGCSCIGEERLKLLTRLIKRKDVTGLINACDAGREGELIFTYVAQHSGTAKPIRRLWLQSMTAQAIRDGFQRFIQIVLFHIYQINLKSALSKGMRNAISHSSGAYYNNVFHIYFLF